MKKYINKLYLFLFCTYPILALWNQNIRFVGFSSVSRVLLVSVIMAAIFWLLFVLLIRDWQKAGLTTAVGVLLFFSYGHIYLFVGDHWEGLAHHRYILGAYLVVFFLSVWLIIWKLKNTDRIEQFLTITSVVLFVSAVLQVGYKEFLVYQASQEYKTGYVAELDSRILEDGGVLPDVYWIILDAYGRSDVLLDYYDYDNSEFIQGLNDMGFYVATCSQTNYPDTILSLVSTMNMNYLQNVMSDSGQLPQLSNSEVRNNFDLLGYQTITFENYFGDHYDLFEDIRLAQDQTVPSLNFIKQSNEFETLLIKTSMLKLFIDMPQLIPDFLRGEVEDSWQYKMYNQTNFSLDTLENMPDLDRPIFVFAHLVVPHSPYIFNPDGSFHLTENNDIASEKNGYINNVAFIDNILPAVLDSIIENSNVPPIIIIQGDHGPTSRDVRPMKRLPILNAFFFPDGTYIDLHSHITPVNTFRIVFNEYFGFEYKLLDDISYDAWGGEQLIDEKIFPNTCISD